MCCVDGCSGSMYYGLSLFKFPKRIELRQKWIEQINRANWLPTDFHVVCSRHFEDHDIEKKQRPRLRKGAYPTLYLDGTPIRARRKKPPCNRAGNGGPVETTQGILFKCCFCAYITRDQLGIINHLVQSTGQELACQQCPESFSNVQDLGRRIAICEEQPSFGSRLCPEEIHGNSDLLAHVRAYAVEKPSECELCPPSFPALFQSRSLIRAQADEKPYKCQQCFEAFALSRNLVMHIQRHAAIMSFKCPICAKAFSGEKCLASHMRVHTAIEGPHRCKQCPKTYLRMSSLKRHIETHEGENNCQQCSWGLTGCLYKHSKWHTSERSLKYVSIAPKPLL